MRYELLSISEAARLLNVCVPTLRRWDRRGKLVLAVRLRRGMRLYRREDLERFMRMARRHALAEAEAAGPTHQPQGGEASAQTQ
jgi:excisionase family DNA binding protein